MISARALHFWILLWPLSEALLAAATRGKADRGRVRDRGSLGLMWGAIALGLTAGFMLSGLPLARMPFPEPWRVGVALVLILGGLAIRILAIITLGRYFTAKVSIQEDHRLVRRGLFRWVRHPSYSGLLLTFMGLAFSLGNWLSFAIVVVPITASVLYRIRVEETLLEEAFGKEYAEYRRTTGCLVPRLF